MVGRDLSLGRGGGIPEKVGPHLECTPWPWSPRVVITATRLGGGGGGVEG